MKGFQCPYCGVGCGLLWHEGKIKGDKKHPASKGDLCKKPLYYPKVMHEGRLLKPMYREEKEKPFREVSWEEAYHILVEKLRYYHPDQLYFYLSGQLLTEDIYVMNKFIKGFLKTNNVDANSRLCMATPVAAYKLAFGSDGPPCTYEDIEEAESFVFVGSNAAWTHPVLFKRVLKRRVGDQKVRIIVIDPVKTETAQRADLHIPIRAGTDIALFNSVLYILYHKGWLDRGFLEKHVEGFKEAMEEALNYPPHKASKICGIDQEHIWELAKLYAFSKKLISFWCQGLNQSSQGVAKNLSFINLHLATGRLNHKGCPFALTGQPNAMGGREMGYLSNGLPGYRDVREEEDREFIETFWGIPKGSIKGRPGPTITEAIDLILEGKINLLWVVCTNPAVSLPNLKKVWRALERVFLVVQDAYWNDTCKLANLLLPAAQMGEKEGVMTGSDRTLTLCRKFSEAPGEAKPDWKIFVDLAHKMGYKEYFSYTSSEDIFKELREATKGRLCDISSFSYKDLPQRWGGKELYSTLRFNRETGKARMYPAKYEHYDAEFILITGRTKNQWHTMTRTGKSLELLEGEEEPFLLINPKDAQVMGINEGSLLKLMSLDTGETIELKVRLGDIKERHLFAPFGYGWDYGKPINLLVGDRKDPVSKEPELKLTPLLVDARDRRTFTYELKG
ncbi:MAG: molybdopterin-dependent oxidoreductase [Aquificaceae bacterium]